MSEKEKNKYIISNNSNISGILINLEEFYLLDNKGIINKIILAQNEEGIIIESNKYFIFFNLTDILSIIPINFKCVLDLYNFFLNLFKEKKIVIKNIIIKVELILEATFLLKEKEEKIIIKLKYSEKNNNHFNLIELYNKNILLNETISKLEKENNSLKNEIKKLKELNKEIKGPQNLKELSQITKDSYSDDVSDNTFTVFKSIQDFIFLVYATKNKSIICYDLIEQIKLIEIKNSHKDFITNFRHFLDKKNNIDIVMTISCSDRNIKLWNALHWECILDLNNIYPEGFIYSSSFLSDSYDNYIVTSNYNYYNSPGFLKIYNFKGKLIKTISTSNENTSYVDTYFDGNNNYIITGNSNRVVAYIYESNKEYKEYKDNYNNNHLSIIIHKNENILKLIESCYDGNIRIWNFHTGELINKIQISNNWLYGICVWNESYLLVGCSDKTIKLMELKDGFISKNMKGHDNSVLTIKKLGHPKYGECLISQGYNEDQIRIWILQ